MRDPPVHSDPRSITAQTPCYHTHLLHRELDRSFTGIRVVHGQQDHPASHGPGACVGQSASMIYAKHRLKLVLVVEWCPPDLYQSTQPLL